MKKVRIARIPCKGLGLVADARIQGGEDILKDYCVIIAEPEWDSIKNTIIRNYIYYRIVEGAIERVLTFGNSAFLNHSDDPNTNKHFEEDALGLWLTLRARRDIAAGEEIQIRYVDTSYIGRVEDRPGRDVAGTDPSGAPRDK